MKRRTMMLGLGAASTGLVAGCQTREASAGAAPAVSRFDPAAMQAAFWYAFPLHEFVRTAQARTGSVGAPGALNRLGHGAGLASPQSRQVTTPNNDTVYSSAFLELSGGPVAFDAPDSPDRYMSVAVMDAFTDNFAYVGTRATAGRGGRFWVVGPGWTGDAPAGVTVFRSSTNDAWLLSRVLVDGPSDLDAARTIQQKLTLSPVSAGAPRPWNVRAADASDAAAFLAVVNEALARSPGGLGHVARAATFRDLGIGPGVAPSADQLVAWQAFLPGALERLRARGLSRHTRVDGWFFPPAGVGEAAADDEVRSVVALGGLAALGASEAIYLQADSDGRNAPLTGAGRYVLRMPPGGVPARAFWSLSMYEAMPDGRFFFAENPIARYAIGDRTPGLKLAPDGSLPIAIQQTPPEGDAAANWLPSPAGRFRLVLRAYLPEPQLLAGRWRPPAVERLA